MNIMMKNIIFGHENRAPAVIVRGRLVEYEQHEHPLSTDNSMRNDVHHHVP